MFVQAHSRNITPQLTLSNTHEDNNGGSWNQAYEQHTHSHTEN